LKRASGVSSSWYTSALLIFCATAAASNGILSVSCRQRAPWMHASLVQRACTESTDMLVSEKMTRTTLIT